MVRQPGYYYRKWMKNPEWRKRKHAREKAWRERNREKVARWKRDYWRRYRARIYADPVLHAAFKAKNNLKNRLRTLNRGKLVCKTCRVIKRFCSCPANKQKVVV